MSNFFKIFLQHSEARWSNDHDHGGWADNISKTIGCMAMKFLHVDGMQNPNICLLILKKKIYLFLKIFSLSISIEIQYK